MNDTRDQIAKLIYNLNPEIQPWDGDPFEFHEPRAGYKKKLAYRQADAVIELLQ